MQIDCVHYSPSKTLIGLELTDLKASLFKCPIDIAPNHLSACYNGGEVVVIFGGLEHQLNHEPLVYELR